MYAIYIYMVTWIHHDPSICPLYVSIYTSTMDPSWVLIYWFFFLSEMLGSRKHRQIWQGFADWTGMTLGAGNLWNMLAFWGIAIFIGIQNDTVNFKPSQNLDHESVCTPLGLPWNSFLTVYIDELTRLQETWISQHSCFFFECNTHAMSASYMQYLMLGGSMLNPFRFLVSYEMGPRSYISYLLHKPAYVRQLSCHLNQPKKCI